MSSFIEQINAILDSLGDDATPAVIANATREYAIQDVLAVMYSRTDDAGGGGGDASFPDEWTVGDNGSLEMAPSGPVEAGSSALTVLGAPTLGTLTVAGGDSGIRFDAVALGPQVTVTMTGASPGGVTVDVVGSAVAIEYQQEVHTVNDVVAAVNGDPAASALLTATATDSGVGLPPVLSEPVPLIGSNAYALDLYSNSDPAAEHGEYVLVWRDENGQIVGHLDNDGGCNFSHERIAFTELGTVEINNGSESPGASVFKFLNQSMTLFQVQAPGGGYGITIGGYAPGDVPFLIYAAGSQTGDLLQLYDENADVPKFRIGPLGHPITRVNAAPADGALAANECGMWFDSSNGAAKVMFKGKTADGTVVDGELALT